MKSEKNESPLFDVGALVAALDAERESRELTWKQVSEASGVSASTLTRLTQGKRPDVDSLAALTAWLGMSADRFLGQKVAYGGGSALAQISSILRDDPNLNANAAATLEDMIKVTYARLKSDRSNGRKAESKR